MRLCIGIIFCSLVMGVSSEGWYSFFKEAFQGAGDLFKAYWDLQVANHQNSCRYFHARGNYDAAQRGPGGIWAAKMISHAKNYLQGLLSQYYPASCNHDLENLESNQRAEEWGRSGKSPDHFRPPDLPEKF
ncbi:serum amyloid A-4 protein-like [Castor canadensis]|uniref:Serum amyloid A-4 protein-like n=1 Tax=Castor canadensis TaxID=51338 RepID=A0AC58K1J0_CASCN